MHTELAEVSLQAALRQRQQQNALAFYQTSRQAGITENRGIKIRAHLAFQGLYINDSVFNSNTLVDSAVLGLALLPVSLLWSVPLQRPPPGRLAW